MDNDAMVREMAEIQPAKAKRTKTGGRDFKPGQSGNPKGRPVAPGRKEALEILKDAAPEITRKALSMVMCAEPNIPVMTALIKKIFPDNINLAAELNLKTLSNEQLVARFVELVGPLNAIIGNPCIDGD
jgi:hypothetical protein